MQFIMLIYSIILWYIILLDLCYILLLLISLKGVLFGYLEAKALEVVPAISDLPLLQPVSILIPVYNGSDLILDCVCSVLQSKGQELISIIIINDGSTDSTLYTLTKSFGLIEIQSTIAQIIPVRTNIRKMFRSSANPNIIVIDKENGGKSDALNAGLNICRTELFITLDHDTLVAPNSIYTMVYTFLRAKNTVAVGGSITILNGCEYINGTVVKERVSNNPLCAVQTVEYLRSFLYARQGLDALGGGLTFAGAFTLFNTRNVFEVGGFDYKNVAQDFEIITHLHRQSREKKYASRVAFAPGAVAWTVVPSTLSAYWRQRTGWQKGSLKSLLMHKCMFFNPKYGVVGLITYPFFILGEISSAFVICVGYFISAIAACFGVFDWRWIVTIFIVSIGLGLSLSLATVFLSLITYDRYKGFKNKLKLFGATIIEGFGIKQFLVICVALATLTYIFDGKTDVKSYD